MAMDFVSLGVISKDWIMIIRKVVLAVSPDD